MSRKVLTILSFLSFVFISVQPGVAVSGKDIIKLKRAGVSDETIQIIVKEKVIETAAFSVEDIVSMKKAGVGEKTLQIIIKEGSVPANPEPIVYGERTRSLRQISPQDVINLKKNGISDSVVQSLIEASCSGDEKERERAWRMLDNMDLRIYVPGGR